MKTYARLRLDGSVEIYEGIRQAIEEVRITWKNIQGSINDYRLDRQGGLWFDHVPTDQERDYAIRHKDELVERWRPTVYVPPVAVVVIRPGQSCVEYPSMIAAADDMGCSSAFLAKMAYCGMVRDGALIITKSEYDRVISEKGMDGICEIMSDPKRRCKHLGEGLPVTSVCRDGTREDFPTRLAAARRHGARGGAGIQYYMRRQRVRHDRMWMTPEEADALIAQGADAVAAEYDRRLEAQPNG